MTKIWITLVLLVGLLVFASFMVQRRPAYEVQADAPAIDPRTSVAPAEARAQLGTGTAPPAEIHDVSPELPQDARERINKPVIATEPKPRDILPGLPAAPVEEPGKPKSEPAKPQTPSKKIVTVPEARTALEFVGMDPDAEEFWLRTINDPSVPADERKDLIEDLNEVGLDERNVTLDDVPLIVNRLDLIERVGPESMDLVNAEAFLEAHKDLTKMLDKLAQRVLPRQ